MEKDRKGARRCCATCFDHYQINSRDLYLTCSSHIIDPLFSAPRLLNFRHIPRPGRKVRRIRLTYPLTHRRTPATTFPRRHLQHIHGIDLLQRPSLTLRHKEIHNHRARETTRRKYIPIPKINRRRNIRREETNQKVPRPVRGGCETHRFRTVT